MIGQCTKHYSKVADENKNFFRVILFQIGPERF